MKTTLFIIPLVSLAFLPMVQAATIGTDAANDAAYNTITNWSDGTDGGGTAAFGTWSLSSDGAQAGHFISSATTGIETGGETFAMFGHKDGMIEKEATAFRSFDTDLALGQTFSIQLKVNFRNGNKGFDLRDGGTTIFNLNVGNNDYTVNNVDSGGGFIFGNTYDINTIFTISMLQTSGAGGTWQVVRSGGLSGTANGTYLGVADNFKLYIKGADNGDDTNQLFVNNISIVPEPTTLGMIGVAMALGSLINARRRRLS